MNQFLLSRLASAVAKPTRTGAAALALFLVTAACLAAPAEARDPDNRLENVIVTGSYSATPHSDLTSTVVVIEREELLALSTHSVVDALRQVPGLWVESQGGPGGLTSIVLRGAEGNHTLVLVDGVQMNDPTNTRGGSFDLNHLNIQSIDRIEIVRGAQSSVYGSDALAGVIHIFTLQAGDGRHAGISAEVGSDDYHSASAELSGRANELAWVLRAQNRDSGEPVPGSQGENNDLVAKLGWKGEQHRLGVALRYFDGDSTTYPEQSGGPEFALSDLLETSDFRSQQAALNWDWQAGKNWRSQLSATWFNREDDYRSPGIVPYTSVPPNGAVTDFSRTSLRWNHVIGFGKSWWSNTGVESRDEDGVSDGYLDIGFPLPTRFDLSRRTNSAYVNVNGKPLEALLLQASVRRDDPDGFESNTSTQFGLRYRLNDQLDLVFNRGEGFKLPSFFALGHPLVGNPDLRPETSETWEAGMEWSDGTLSGTFNLFSNKYRDLIDFDPEEFTNVNRARVDIQGLDGSLRWQSADQRWRAQGQFTYNDIDAPRNLNGRPELSLGGLLEFNPVSDWSFNVQGLWVDQRYATSLYTGAPVQESLDSYLRWDAGARVTLADHWLVSLQVQNITDSDYHTDVGFPAPGVAYYLGLGWRL